MRNNEVATTVYKDTPDQDLRQESKIGNDYVGFEDIIIEMLSDFEFMWDGHQSRINNAGN